jgi:hypothetical protein
MITVYRVPISKEQFRKIPDEERAFVLLLGHAINQLNVLRKIAIFSKNEEPNDPVEGRISAGQSQIVIRYLFGVVAETWEFIRRSGNQKIIGDYLSELSEEGRASYDQLKTHFGRSNLLHRVRNALSFHYPPSSKVITAFEAIPEDDDWEWYLSQTNTNTVYFSCEMVLGYGLLLETGEPVSLAAFAKAMAEVRTVADVMPFFIMPLIKAILVRHLGWSALNATPVTTIENAPDLHDFWIPFFVERRDMPEVFSGSPDDSGLPDGDGPQGAAIGR